MKIISWNVNGIRAITKKNFFKDIEILAPNILCIQETKAQNEQVQEAIKEMKEYKYYTNSAERKGYSGTSILTKKPPLSVSFGIKIKEHDNEGRVITAEFNDFFLINVYVPNSGAILARLDYREEWDKDFKNYIIEKEKIKPVIICGDLNVAHQPIDIARPKSNYNKTAGYTQKEIDGLTKIIDNGYLDTWRYFNPEKIKYSWWSYRMKAREKNIGWRIDYFLTSKKIINKVQNIDILNDIKGSDHCPVELILKAK